MVVGAVVLETSQEKVTKPPALGVGPGGNVLFEEVNEEALGEIFGLDGGTTRSAEVGLEGRPVSGAEPFQGGGGVRVAAGVRRQDYTPVRGSEESRRGGCRRWILSVGSPAPW